MADLLLATRHGKPTGVQWAYRFVQRRPELKARLSCAYDKQRALCEDPEPINVWFRLVDNMRKKYAIQDTDFYNFDKTGFMMGMICSGMVVTGANREGRRKHLQAGNREWATAIECISSDGFVVPPYLILQGKHHLASWYTECGIPDHFNTMTMANIQAGFRGAGLVPFNPQAVISKLDIKLRTPTPTGPPLSEADPWVSQTPHNPADAVSQSVFVQNRIARHQGSSPTTIFSAVKQLASGTERIAHEMTLLTDRVRTLEKANSALAKRRRAKRTHLQDGGSLSIEDAQVLIDQKEAKVSKRQKMSVGGGESGAGPATQRHCRNCGKTGHNVRTCQ